MTSALLTLVILLQIAVSFHSGSAQQDQFFPFRNDYNFLGHHQTKAQEGPFHDASNRGRQLVPFTGFRNDYSPLGHNLIDQDGPFWDGSYYFRYVNDDGTIREESGRPGLDGQLVIMGSYQYPADYTTGYEILTKEYIADSNGYRAFPEGTNPEYIPPQRILDPGLPPPNRNQLRNYSPGFFAGNNYNQAPADFNAGQPDRLSRAISRDIARRRQIFYCNYINPRKVPAVWYWNYC